MGASLGTGDKKSVNVELNIVPFIDLMSCLTAFLLVTAVWVNIAQINIQPKGKTRDNGNPEPEEIVRLSVLVQADRIWIGLSRLLGHVRGVYIAVLALVAVVVYARSARRRDRGSRRVR